MNDDDGPPRTTTSPSPQLADHFERGSALKLVHRGHPYDFADTYQLLRSAYGYTSHYVNLGLWDASLVPDSADLDPATRLVRFLANKADVHNVGHVLDVGSGLGQGAIDLQGWLHARRVSGVNINIAQLGFATALSASAGLSAQITHQAVDACDGLPVAFGPGAFDAAFAVECIGHFQRPQAFLAGLRTTLKAGAPFVCCLNVALGSLPLSFRTMMRLTYGFVPRPRTWWTDAMTTAGLEVTDHGDITRPVLQTGTAAVSARLRDPEIRRTLPPLTTWLVERQLALTARAVAAGHLGYVWIRARRPA